MEVGQLQFKFSLPLQTPPQPHHPLLSSSTPHHTHTLPATTHHTTAFQPLAHSCNQSLDLWTQTKPNKQTNDNFFQGLCQWLKSGGGTATSPNWFKSVWPKTLTNQRLDWNVRLGLQDLEGGIPLMLINYQPLSWMSDETLMRSRHSLICMSAKQSYQWGESDCAIKIYHDINWYKTEIQLSRLDCVQCLLVS